MSDQGEIQWYGKFAYLPQLKNSVGQVDPKISSEFAVVKDIHPHLSGGEYTRLEVHAKECRR